MTTLAIIFDRIFFILAGNEDNHKVWTEFEIRPSALEFLKKSLDLKWEKCCENSSAFIFNWIVFILSGNKDNHKSLDVFEFGQMRQLTTE